eukprot:965271-Rhodomonas_salina.1
MREGGCKQTGPDSDLAVHPRDREHGRSRWQKLGVVAALLAALVAITALATLTRPAQPEALSEAAALRLAEEDFEEPQEIEQDVKLARHAELSSVPQHASAGGLAMAAQIHAASLEQQLPPVSAPPQPLLAAAPPAPAPAPAAPVPAPALAAAAAAATPQAAKPPQGAIPVMQEAVQKPAKV